MPPKDLNFVFKTSENSRNEMYSARARKNAMPELDLGPAPAEFTAEDLSLSLAHIEFSMPTVPCNGLEPEWFRIYTSNVVPESQALP